ncbi:MAG: N-acyl homoserine lactonase family protein [Candidatus Tectomicrobia bacterium]|nr:N-acyl homoserine lactonase family protein [Candidatus Tectomicrobia bacterium]
MRLYLLQYGLSSDGVPIPGYLVQTSDGMNILVDTGYPAEAIGTEPFPALQITSEDHVVQQLARIGLTPADIHSLVCTHFDSDHAGAHDLFPTAELIVQRQHYDVAHSGATDRFEIYRAHWDHPALHYRLIDGDTVLVPGVELIDTSGHVLGHQSVLVRLPETGPVLLAIDAVPFVSQLDPATYQPTPYDIDPVGAAAGVRKLQDLIVQEGVTLTICGHDAQQWATLRKIPAYYS